MKVIGVFSAILAAFALFGDNGCFKYHVAGNNPTTDIMTVIKGMINDIEHLKEQNKRTEEREKEAKSKMASMKNEIGVMKAKLLTGGNQYLYFRYIADYTHFGKLVSYSIFVDMYFLILQV